MSTDSTSLSLSTQAATTSGFSLNKTTLLNDSIESTSDVTSDHSTPPRMSTDSPTVTAADPCCKNLNTTEKTDISSSGQDSVTVVAIAVSAVLFVLFIVIILGICYYRRKRRFFRPRTQQFHCSLKTETNTM